MHIMYLCVRVQYNCMHLLFMWMFARLSEFFLFSFGKWQVEKLLEDFVASQLTLLTRRPSAFGATNRAAVEGTAEEIEAGRLWEGEMRRDLARVLIQRMDVKNEGTLREDFVPNRTLYPTRRGAPTRRWSAGTPLVQCHSPRSTWGPHEALCPHRLMRCRQGCTEAVPRGAMGSHCGTTCPMRVLPCPFAALPGCACGARPLLQKDLRAHLEQEAQAHQLLMLQAVVANQELAHSLAQRLSLLEKVSSTVLYCTVLYCTAL